ncbi:hypothetical protein ABH942_000223 [Flavobacterium sp. 28YEA47A]|uniref:DUF6048 family protein n=1 Tax=Flavobacterium sp. 28YEA47A TaxID=3156276 RepID=UPI003519D7C2
MKYTLKSIFNLALVLISLSAFAQDKKKDTVVPRTERYGLRVGTDLYKIARSIYDSDYKGFEITGDYRLTQKIYIAGEIGNENKTTDEPQLNFTTKGTYFKAGFDYNIYKNWLDMENMITLGMRYGFSSFTQELNSYSIYNPHPYFDESDVITVSRKYSGLSAHWVEFVAGIKAEVFDNFFMGFTLRMNRLVSNKKPSDFDNLYIPGFNRTYDGDFGVGFNYTVSYFIPIYKKQNLPKTEDKDKDKGKKKE